MQLAASLIAIAFAILYFGFYGLRIGDLAFWAVIAIGLVPMVVDLVGELRRSGS